MFGKNCSGMSDINIRWHDQRLSVCCRFIVEIDEE